MGMISSKKRRLIRVLPLNDSDIKKNGDLHWPPGILSCVKPSNLVPEKDKFMKNSYNYDPIFRYLNPLPDDVLQRFNEPSHKYLPQAIKIMETVLKKFGSYEQYEKQCGGITLSRAQAIAAVFRYLKKEKFEDDEIAINLSDDLLSNACMSSFQGRSILNIRAGTMKEKWMEGMLAHEIGTHYLRSYNNRYQPWNSIKGRQRYCLRPVNPTEEGIACLHSVINLEYPLLWRPAVLYYTASKAGVMSFKQLFKDLEKYVADPAARWRYCMRAKRGRTNTSVPGAFAKDQVYLKGALHILKHSKTIDFHALYKLGKVAYQDVETLVPYGNMDDDRLRIPSFITDLGAYRAKLARILKLNGLTRRDMNEVRGDDINGSDYPQG